MMKSNEKLTQKLVQIGGAGILDEMAAEQSDSADECLSPTTRAKKRALKLQTLNLKRNKSSEHSDDECYSPTTRAKRQAMRLR